MIKKNDFIEVDFTAKVKETERLFDTTLPDEAKKANLPVKEGELKPLKICVGQGMVVSGFDKALEGKDIGKNYTIELKPKEAFGERNAKLIKVIPMRVFTEKEVVPVSGMMLTLDGILARIASVSGGRVVVDFNNPLAGKAIEYNFTVKRHITKTEEKIAVLADFYLGEKLETKPEIKVDEENKTAEVEVKSMPRRSEIFIKKAKEILDISVKIKTKSEKKEEKSNKRNNYKD